MSWDGYLYRLKSQEEEMFKVQEELEREVREVYELLEKECLPPRESPKRKRLNLALGETLQ